MIHKVLILSSSAISCLLRKLKL